MIKNKNKNTSINKNIQQHLEHRWSKISPSNRSNIENFASTIRDPSPEHRGCSKEPLRNQEVLCSVIVCRHLDGEGYVSVRSIWLLRARPSSPRPTVLCLRNGSSGWGPNANGYVNLRKTGWNINYRIGCSGRVLDGFGTWLSVRIRNSVNVLDWVLGDVKKCCVELISLGEIQGHVLVKICAYYLHKFGVMFTYWHYIRCFYITKSDFINLFWNVNV